MNLLKTPQGKPGSLNRLARRWLVKDGSFLHGDGQQTCFEIQSNLFHAFNCGDLLFDTVGPPGLLSVSGRALAAYSDDESD